MRWKQAFAMVVSVVIMGSMAMTSYAGQWIFEGPENWKWKYQNDGGNNTVNDWQEIDEKWYHFDKDGYLDMGWHNYPVYVEDTIFGGYYKNQWYHLDENTGAMATEGEWEGGRILADGLLQVDFISYDVIDNPMTGKQEITEISYIRNTDERESYKGTLEWKTKLMSELQNKLTYDYGTYNIDFQLPSNWQEQCPYPLLNEMLDDFFDGNYSSEECLCEYQCNVQDNVFHITFTTFSGQPEDMVS